MIELEECDYKILLDIGKRHCKNYKMLEIEDKYFITKDEMIAIIESLEEEYVFVEEKLMETDKTLNDVWREKQGSWLDPYIRMKMAYEELEEKLEAIKSTLNEDDYDKLNERGVEV